MSEKNETVNINVLIADRSYPVKVVKGNEEKVQNAVMLANEQIKQFQQLYGGKDKQDYLAMCLLNYAVEYANFQSSTQQNNRLLEEKITELEQVLTAASK